MHVTFYYSKTLTNAQKAHRDAPKYATIAKERTHAVVDTATVLTRMDLPVTVSVQLIILIVYCSNK